MKQDSSAPDFERPGPDLPRAPALVDNCQPGISYLWAEVKAGAAAFRRVLHGAGLSSFTRMSCGRDSRLPAASLLPPAVPFPPYFAFLYTNTMTAFLQPSSPVPVPLPFHDEELTGACK